ncbi:MAG: hypothetical protein QT08_C0017G0043 [archaeon GW2011_AR17]|nr:MAG: hypothetical protein QT08_C0017G0043 [archaeon GW2011_AR17]MBS3154365.1 hypothetical protein [Candidatus Woesearchaeota archaeon]HIH15424.1 hypothetical protein [Nanoarchaeota archaeon]HIH58908.1 hypothetical protein [Nanoarchaeota archaeon]HII13986.1 hypothetical protein [Nanoarchaeota archaeon]
MKRGKIIILIVISILVLSACKEYKITEVEKITEDIAEEENESEEEIVEEEPEVQEEEIIPAAEKFELFNPEITYKNFYNGPLYNANKEWNTSSAALFEKEEENGINFMLVQTSEEDTESLKGIIQENPSQIILMINPGLATEKAKQALFNDELPQKYKDAEKDARGVFGEGSITGLGRLEFSSWNVQTTNYKIQELYNFAEEKKYLLFLEINAGEAQRDEFEETLIEYPNTTFLIHIEAKEFQSNEQKIRELMQKYENIYLIIDANDILYDGQQGLFETYKTKKNEEAKELFIEEFDTSYERYITDANQRYTTLIETLPNKVLWSFEMGPEYNYDPEIYDRAIKVSRGFISTLNTEYQEGIAYKNAVEILGKGIE